MAEKWVFLNGDFILESLASIPVNDRGFLFGDGMFTTIRVHQGKCELFNRHMQRLQQQAEILNFDLSSLKFDWIPELIQRNEAWEGTWRLKIMVTVKQERTIRTVGNALATLAPYQSKASESCTLCLFPYPFERPLAHLKSLSHLDYLYVRTYANQRGYDDAITKTRDGILLETSCSNLFWIDQGRCCIPDQELPYLKGIFLQALLPHLPLPLHFVKATFDQVSATAHMYTCNALTHVRSVSLIDRYSFPRNQQWDHVLQRAAIEALKMDSL
jgi:4-amino-4-deoxychorismate lyase